jgi:signal transduction histidine kinase
MESINGNSPIEQLRTMETFLGMFAHELKTQISGIPTACYFAQQGINSGFYLHAIDTVAQNTLHVLDDMLQTVRIRQGKLEIRPVNETFPLRSWIEARIQSFETSLLNREKSINLIISPALFNANITTDKVKLGQVLHNLLTNAMKFRFRNTLILVKCESICECLIIRVENHGKTIPQEKISYLFKPYHQLDKSHAGTGLGLHLSRLYIEALGGTLVLNSDADITTLTVTIPQ